MTDTQKQIAPLRGTVLWFDHRRGFGFLRRDDGEPDVFVHWTGIDAYGYRQLLPEQRVEFTVVQGEKGPMATNVRVVGN